MAIGAASALLQKTGEAADRRRFPPPGRLVTVNGRRLHLWCAGEGSPTVVVVPSLGGRAVEWVGIQRRLAPSMRVCLYDRGGLGWSDHVPGPRTADALADELHALLTAAAVSPPYVLVGHSLGGLVAQLYAARYLDQLAGLVLVDSSHQDQMLRLAEELGWQEAGFKYWKYAAQRRLRMLALLRAGTHLGWVKQYRQWAAYECPPDFVEAGVALASTSRHRRTVIREMLGFRRSTQQVRAARARLDQLPVAVVTSSPDSPNYAPGSTAAKSRRRMYGVWRKLQDDLTGLSTNSRHMVATQAGHHVHLDDPDLVVKAIREISRSASWTVPGQ